MGVHIPLLQTLLIALFLLELRHLRFFCLGWDFFLLVNPFCSWHGKGPRSHLFLWRKRKPEGTRVLDPVSLYLSRRQIPGGKQAPIRSERAYLMKLCLGKTRICWHWYSNMGLGLLAEWNLFAEPLNRLSLPTKWDKNIEFGDAVGDEIRTKLLESPFMPILWNTILQWFTQERLF